MNSTVYKIRYNNTTEIILKLIVDSQNYQRSDGQFTIDSTNINSDDE